MNIIDYPTLYLDTNQSKGATPLVLYHISQSHIVSLIMNTTRNDPLPPTEWYYLRLWITTKSGHLLFKTRVLLFNKKGNIKLHIFTITCTILIEFTIMNKKNRFYSLNVKDIKEIVCFPQNEYCSENYII
jgi:hypothetical protein